MDSSKKQIKKLLDKKTALEKAYPQIIRAWNSYCGLNDSRKQQIENEWSAYYEAIRSTKAYKRFFKMKELWTTGRTEEMKAFAKKAREQIKVKGWEIVEPQGIDPVILKNNPILNSYLAISTKIKQMQEEGSDYDVIGF